MNETDRESKASLPATSRRTFIRNTAMAAAALHVVPGYVVGTRGQTPPSDRLNIAGVGIGGMGRNNLKRCAETENIVALCDIDQKYAAKTFADHPKSKVYSDYREMIDKQKDIDAIVIATPDHTHAVIALEAMRAGKHVYVQKPLTHSVFEARTLTEAARKYKVATQMGNQGHSGDGARLCCEWIWADAIGGVREVHAWTNRPVWPQGIEVGRPVDTPAVPEGFDWDRWIGPAPMRPYHPAYHPAVWRCWQDFGSGMMGDRGAHTIDPIVWALRLGAPTSAEATTMGQTAETHPLAAVVTFEFPARGNLPPVTRTWYEGTRAPRPDELEEGRKMGDGEGGAIFKGNKGKIMCGTYGNSPRIIPESRMKEYKRPAPSLPRVPDSHEMDWVRACKGQGTAGADFAYSGPLTEICRLGNLAQRVDGKIVWNASEMKVTNDPKADAFVRTEYRKGWSL